MYSKYVGSECKSCYLAFVGSQSNHSAREKEKKRKDKFLYLVFKLGIRYPLQSPICEAFVVLHPNLRRARETPTKSIKPRF